MRIHPANTLALPASVVTVGAFDGVHLGHQTLIRQLVDRSRILGVPAVVYTFHPPPRCYFQQVPMLTTLDTKLQRIARLEVDHVVTACFDENYLSRSAESFIEELLALNPVEVWVGSDFRFGYGRRGGVHELSSAFRVRVVDPISCSGGEVISSSRIRSLLACGRREEARELLGYL
jgi:riboflavin kinase / FMN adenylyltransferase